MTDLWFISSGTKIGPLTKIFLERVTSVLFFLITSNQVHLIACVPLFVKTQVVGLKCSNNIALFFDFVLRLCEQPSNPQLIEIQALQ